MEVNRNSYTLWKHKLMKMSFKNETALSNKLKEIHEIGQAIGVQSYTPEKHTCAVRRASHPIKLWW